MILLLLLLFNLNSAQAQTFDIVCATDGSYVVRCGGPLIVIDEDRNNSSNNNRNFVQGLVSQQERYHAEYTAKYIEAGTTRMKNEQVKAKQSLVESALRSNPIIQPLSKESSWKREKWYIDDAESLKNKVDLYNQQISGRRGFSNSVDTAESIIYSNISGSYPKGYNADGIFIPEAIDSKIPKSPLSNFKTEVDINKSGGQIVRRMANKYQAFWGENSLYLQRSYGESSQYYLGVSFLRLANENSLSNPMQAQAYLEMAKNILDFSEGVVSGAIKNFETIIKLMPEMGAAAKEFAKAVYNDPSYLTSSTLNLMMSSPKIAASLTDHLKEQYEVLKNGSARERGEIVGEYALDIVGLIGTSGSSIAISGAKTGAIATGKTLAKEIGEEIITNPRLQKTIATNILPAVEEAVEISSVLKNATREQYIKALELNLDLKKAGAVNITSEALEFTQKVPGTKGAVEWNHSVLIKDIHKVESLSANDVNILAKIKFESNPINKGKDYKFSYKPDTKVFKYVTSTPISGKFVRVYPNPNDMVQSWILDRSAIEGLTRQQIKDKFALPRIPQYIADVDLPAGVPIQTGVPNAVFDSSGKYVAKQYEILKNEIPASVDFESFFKHHRELP